MTYSLVQTQFIALAGRIGGPNAGLPESVTGLSGGLSWTNFHFIPSPYASRSDRRLESIFDKCEIAQSADIELTSTLLSCAVAIVVVAFARLVISAILKSRAK